ncbi:hypothetical protein [Bhargavaea ullalensis]|uniref:Uncharacterized protein n=1 Tax=Bhargavaea ullalensis TaxID=1265685 RepID=A0ABV2GA50_9BACL
MNEKLIRLDPTTTGTEKTGMNDSALLPFSGRRAFVWFSPRKEKENEIDG